MSEGVTGGPRARIFARWRFHDLFQNWVLRSRKTLPATKGTCS
jgi:hypothetical protein